MAQSYTVLWTLDRCKTLKELGDAGKPLEVLFGGGHLSLPLLSSYGVSKGDFVYPVYVKKKVLHIVGRLKVDSIIPIKQYIADELKVSKKDQELDIWDLEEKLWKERPELGHKLPYGCVHEAALGEGTQIDFGNAIPPDMLERIRYVSKNGERAIKHVVNGELRHSISIQGGVYRLSPDSAKEFARRLRRRK